MKRKLPVLLALVAFGIPGAFAENAPGDGPSGQRPKQMGRDFMREKMLERLSPENRERFEKARRLALEDPKIAALRSQAEKSNREFFEAMRQKMNELDPGLEEIIKQGMANRQEKDGPGRKGGQDGERGLASLSEGERQRLMAAREVAKNDPAVLAAEQKRNAATTPEDKMSAGMEFAKAMREAILKMDPSMESILNKVHTPRKPQPGPKPESGSPQSPPPAQS
jgi:ABC-type uncharacterized transport system ATPase subunit